MKFTDRYNRFIKKYVGWGENNPKGLLPNIQIDSLENNPILNPRLNPPPQDWFINTFEWHVGI